MDVKYKPEIKVKASLESEDLSLYIMNTEHIYRSHLPTIKNLAKKIVNGTYEPERAFKEFMNLAQRGIYWYHQEIDCHVFTAEEKKACALELMDQFQDEIEYQIAKLV